MRKVKKETVIEITEEIRINEDTILEVGDKIQVLNEADIINQGKGKYQDRELLDAFTFTSVHTLAPDKITYSKNDKKKTLNINIMMRNQDKIYFAKNLKSDFDREILSIKDLYDDNSEFRLIFEINGNDYSDEARILMYNEGLSDLQTINDIYKNFLNAPSRGKRPIQYVGKGID